MCAPATPTFPERSTSTWSWKREGCATCGRRFQDSSRKTKSRRFWTNSRFFAHSRRDRMTTIRSFRFVLLLILTSLGLAAAAEAQTNDEVFPQVQWNFSTPGARANGMGRTFIGTADDASAAVTNPAGLMNLTRPQVYAEYKNTDLSVDRLAAPDSFKTLQPSTFTSNINALSFVNYSMPLTDKLAFGFTINQFLYYREVFALSPRTLVNQSNGNYIDIAAFGVKGDVDLKATSFGGSVAYAVRKDLMVGVSVSAN